MALGWESFLLVVGRLSGLFISTPVWSSRQIPTQVKVFFILMFSALVSMVTPVDATAALAGPGYFFLALGMEVLVGYAMGFVAYVVFAGIQLAGQLMDMQMGFGLVNVIDPQSGTQVPLIGNFQFLVALMVFLSVNGHHLVLSALNDSYKYIPVLGANLDGNFFNFMMNMGGYMFVIGVKLATPVVAALFLADIALGFIARTVPQMHVFIIGLPMKIGVGLALVMVTMPVFIWFISVLMERFFVYMEQLIIILGK
ncbi:MAG: flagellar type III secretion system protein FliR [Syntrophomonadaceae bacterium]|nr:flagellar type III secretion system protein FliR [Syntrophomonadaceae bacterium]